MQKQQKSEVPPVQQQQANANTQKLQQQPKNESNNRPVQHRSASSSSFSSRSNSSSSMKSSHQKSVHSQQEGVKQQNVVNKQPERRIRYKYCCKICKHTDKSKKACVCVVPKGQRRTQIGQQGCQTCGCNGCSKQDFISRGEDPEYRPGDKQKRINRRDKEVADFEARNGCCRKCMKAFSKSNKSCLCQVPEDVRNTKLPSSGCKICGCFGCNPEDKKDPRNRRAPKKQRERQRSRSREKRRRYARSEQSEQSQSSSHGDMNLYNIEKSVIGSVLVKQLRVSPQLVGFGIPQRSYNYIMGKPK